ncbi:HD domain-containing protein [Stetteria hydrogenophila]
MAAWPPRGLEGEAELVKSIIGLDEAHGWPHVERVAGLAFRIAGELGGVDYDVLGASVLYHDVGRPLEGVVGVHHAVISARVARARLRLLGWDPRRIALVENAVLSHSYSLRLSMGVEPESVEAMILSDADKLDALGAVGVARVLITGAQRGRSLRESLEHFKSKILRLPSLLYTEPAKRLAARLVRVVECYTAALEEELGLHSSSGAGGEPPGPGGC